MNLQVTPQTSDLEMPLGVTFPNWKEIRDNLLQKDIKRLIETKLAN